MTAWLKAGLVAGSVVAFAASVAGASGAAGAKTLAYVSGIGLYISAADGSGQASAYDGNDSLSNPSWSANGRLLLVTDLGETQKLALLDPATGKLGAIDNTEDADSGSWSSDGSVVFAVGTSGDVPGIKVVQINGKGLRKLTTPTESQTDSAPSVSPDGRSVAFVRQDMAADGTDVTTIEVMAASGGVPRAIAHGALVDPGTGQRIAWSPDGKKLAFVSGDGGIELVGAGGLGKSRLTNNDGDYWPNFAAGGSSILFSRYNAGDGDQADDQAGVDNNELWTVSAMGTGEKRLSSNDFEQLVSYTPPTQQPSIKPVAAKPKLPFCKTGRRSTKAHPCRRR